MNVNYLSISNALINQGIISKEEMEKLNADNGNKSEITLPGLLLQQEKIREQDLLQFWSKELGYHIQSKIADEEIFPEIVQNISIQFLKKNLVFPLKIENNTLTVAHFDPLRQEAIDQLRVLTQKEKVQTILCPSSEILSAINRAYGEVSEGAENIIQDLDQEEDSFISELEEGVSEDLLDETSDAPIIKLVNHILSQAVRYEASDIHIEPYQHNLKVRYRLDGVLYNIFSFPKKLHAAVTSRLKILANLNIAEKRIPQDGRIQVKIGNRNVDLRVSSLPTAFGERMVLRLLEKDQRVLNLQEIGLDDDYLQKLKKLIHISHGIILVTGPTGSGKTTTLYSALNEINTSDKNILTVEDPIEYQMEGIGQMQVNSKIGLTFANGLRSMVRQDPDVILVGEIRDLETAEIAIQAALTGHLVFSTLHTNDASGAITRLINMGIEPFLVSSSIQGILAQRLVRTLCPKCKQAYSADPMLIQEFGLDPTELLEQLYTDSSKRDQNGQIPASAQYETFTLYTPQGCDYCMHTGYKGRTGIFEFLTVSEQIQSLMLKTSESNQIRNASIQEGMTTLRQYGVNKILNGITTVDEVLRVTQV